MRDYIILYVLDKYCERRQRKNTKQRGSGWAV